MSQIEVIDIHFDPSMVEIVEGISKKDTIAKNAQYLMDSESFIKTE